MAQRQSIGFNDYSMLINDYEKRLDQAIASQDQIGQRHEHFHLGHAYLYLANFDRALEHYRKALSLAETMQDGSLVAQINFIVGRVYSLKQDYDLSIYFHDKHLELARRYQDFQGQSQAYFILSQLNEKINQFDKSKQLLSLYKALTHEIDQTERKTNLLKTPRLESRSISVSECSSPYGIRSNSMLTNDLDEKSNSNLSRRFRLNFMQNFIRKSPLAIRKQSEPDKSEDLFDIVYRMQKSRFDDQRCQIPIHHQTADKRNLLKNHRASTQLEDIMTTVDRLQQCRLDDQRTVLRNVKSNQPSTRLSPLNEQFLDQLSKCQGSRFEDQRATLTPTTTHRRLSTGAETINDISVFKTLPDEEFFRILHHVQSQSM